MEIKPFVSGLAEAVEVKVSGRTVWELSDRSAFEILRRGVELQAILSKIPLKDRLKVFDEMGKMWREMLQKGDLDELAKELSGNTGYCRKLIEMEFSLVPEVLKAENISRNLEASFPSGARSLEQFVEVSEGEYCRYLPVGPVFIISSGNSLIPPLIPTTFSLATGNFTLLRPSLANYCAVVKVYKLLNELSGILEAAKPFSEALAISYFAHESPTLKHILSSAPLGLVNFWGGEPGRSAVGKIVSENPHHPRYLVNGPLTGFAIIDEGSADEASARGLAFNMILYDQQLCSSPTMAAFVGSWKGAVKFVERVGRYLDVIGSEYELEVSEDFHYVLQSVRRILQTRGSRVYFSSKTDNAWTLVLSPKKSQLEAALAYFPSFNIYNRKRFLEILVVDSMEQALEQISKIPKSGAFVGVDRVQTVGLAVESNKRGTLLEKLAERGVYRITPIEDMNMRSPIEPYDGVYLASALVYAVYSREKTVQM